ncbi:MAG: DUF692 domain-containing protein [Tolumonas sp.]|nr:DUF692 domain-containing protein [Tolumonas sp.]
MSAALSGFGLGLRPEHYQDFITQKQPLDWLEILSDNYLVAGGKPLFYLDQIRQDYPLVMHGVAMNIGSIDPLNFDYLTALKQLAKRIEPALISDHLCWTGVHNQYLHDLLPLPYTDETISHVADRILQIQDFLGRRLVIENLSSYIQSDTGMSEWEFIGAICQQADCDLLLDINNIFVSSHNHGFDPLDYLHGIPAQRVRQIHLAGHSQHENYLIDTHDQPVCDEVWQLYQQAIHHLGFIPTMIERDGNIPPLPELLAEVNHARNMIEVRYATC